MAKIPCTISQVNDKIVKLTPNENLLGGTDYKITIEGDIKSVDGEIINVGVVSDFKTVIIPVIFLQDIDNLRNNLSSNLTLDQDLDFNDDASYDQSDPDWQTKKTTWTTGGWIGAGGYSGTLDGNNFSISGFNQLGSGRSTAGLFRYIEGAVIKNLTISGNINISNVISVGLISGSGSDNSKITNCHTISEFSIENTNTSNIGGLVGSLYDSEVDNCSSSVLINVTSGSYSAIGGIVGTSGDSISISNSYSSGSITCLSSNIWVGGFAGVLDNSYSSGTTNCYTTCIVNNVSESQSSGFAPTGGDIVSCYYDSDTSSHTDTKTGTPKTTIEMKQQSTFIGWDFDNIWDIEEGVSYPNLLVVDS